MGAMLGDFRANWRPFLAIHIVVTAVVVVVLGSLASVLLRLAVLLSGEPVLSDQDILFFILSPAGFIAFIVLAAIYSIVAFLEYAALIMTAWMIEKGKPVTVRGVLAFLASRASRLFGLALQILLRVLVFTTPFLALLGAIYLALLSDYDINFYLSNTPGEWYTALVLAGGVAVAWSVLMIYLVCSWIFSLPLLLLAGLKPRAALAASVDACRGKRFDIFFALIGWLVFSILLGLLAALPAAAASWLLIPLGSASVKGILLTMGLVALLGAAGSLLASLASVSVLSLLTLRLFRAYGLWRTVELDLHTHVEQATGAAPGRRALALALAVLLVAPIGVTYGLLKQLKFDQDVDVMAHRGASLYAPENTLAAVRAAIDAGAQWVEIDVQETVDGAIVVIHDGDLKRVGGVPMVVAESTARELGWVDVGSWFDLAYSDERVPSLREVLELCKDRVGVNIELKYYGGERRLEQSVAEIVEDLGMADQVVFMSLSLPGIRKMKQLRPDWKVGLLSSVAVGDLARLDVDFVALNARFTSRSLVRDLHRSGMEVMVWTVNDALGISVMAGRGVDAIITDDPGLAVEILAQRRELEAHGRLMLGLAELFDRPSLVSEQ
jgi:glycerophosphoryl diester phosphodiesterase